MYVLDTNTLIYFFKGEGNVARKLLTISPKEIAIPAIVVYEIEYGIAKSTSPKKDRLNYLKFVLWFAYFLLAMKKHYRLHLFDLNWKKREHPLALMIF